MKIGLSIWMFVPGTGGLYKHAEDLVFALNERGHDVVVVTRFSTLLPQGLEFVLIDEGDVSAVRNGIEIRHLRYLKGSRLIRWLVAKTLHRPFLRSLSLKLFHLLADRSAVEMFAGCDLIHHVGQSNALVGFAAEAAARTLRIPFLVQPTCHPNQAGDDPLDHLLFQRADRLLVHTQYEANYFRSRAYALPIDVVGNGIEDRNDGDANRFRQAHRIEGPMILFLGRKEPDKGYPLLLDSFQILKRLRPEATLVCLGPKGAEESEPAAGVIDLGFASEQTKHDALAACTCLCVPSEGESFGLVFMEAARYGKPVVARRLPVLLELLDDGEAALLLGSATGTENHIALTADELITALLSLIDSGTLCQSLGERGRRCSEAFLWKNTVKRFEESYERSIN